MSVTSVDVDALYAALNNKRQVANLSWRQLATALEVAPSTFTRMAQGLRPDVDTFATLLRWLNMPAEAFTRTTPGSEAIPTDDEPEPMASYLATATVGRFDLTSRRVSMEHRV